jgi:hypothetical protein
MDGVDAILTHFYEEGVMFFHLKKAFGIAFHSFGTGFFFF